MPRRVGCAGAVLMQLKNLVHGAEVVRKALQRLKADIKDRAVFQHERARALLQSFLRGDFNKLFTCNSCFVTGHDFSRAAKAGLH
jgi:hypothetical protein